MLTQHLIRPSDGVNHHREPLVQILLRLVVAAAMALVLSVAAPTVVLQPLVLVLALVAAALLVLAHVLARALAQVLRAARWRLSSCPRTMDCACPPPQLVHNAPPALDKRALGRGAEMRAHLPRDNTFAAAASSSSGASKNPHCSINRVPSYVDTCGSGATTSKFPQHIMI